MDTTIEEAFDRLDEFGAAKVQMVFCDEEEVPVRGAIFLRGALLRSVLQAIERAEQAEEAQEFENAGRLEDILAAAGQLRDVPEAAVHLSEAPPGLFLSEDGTLGFKSEYFTESGEPEAFVCASGEYFWGGASTQVERRYVSVWPLQFSAPEEPGAPEEPHEKT